MSNDCKNLQHVSDNGVYALDLIGVRAKGDDFRKCEEMLQMNFGSEYPKEKFHMLWEMIAEDGWSQERLISTVKWFLKNKRYPNWTIADWFDYGVKLYPYSWKLSEIHKGAKDSEFDAYRLTDGKLYFRYRDGHELPFEKFIPAQPQIKKNVETQSQDNADVSRIFQEMKQNWTAQ